MEQKELRIHTASGPGWVRAVPDVPQGHLLEGKAVTALFSPQGVKLYGPIEMIEIVKQSLEAHGFEIEQTEDMVFCV